MLRVRDVEERDLRARRLISLPIEALADRFLHGALSAAEAGAGVYVTCRLVAEFGGGRFAQVLAAIVFLFTAVLSAFGGKVGPDEVGLLENLRYDPGEEANDKRFAARLAALADAYVDDAFGAVHRAHASVVGVAEQLPSAAGLLLQKEVDVLSRLVESPDRPFVLVLGGAKVSGKLKYAGDMRALRLSPPYPQPRFGAPSPSEM